MAYQLVCRAGTETSNDEIRIQLQVWNEPIPEMEIENAILDADRLVSRLEKNFNNFKHDCNILAIEIRLRSNIHKHKERIIEMQVEKVMETTSGENEENWLKMGKLC